MTDAKYIIGIDLGTTNCTVAYTEACDSDAIEIQQLPLTQMLGQGDQGNDTSLPSFLYFPLEEEQKAKTFKTDWEGDSAFCVGTLARERGAELPNRLISSAKSWLCHDSIDRRERILPLHFEGEKMSPVEVLAAYMKHIKAVWEQQHEGAPFEKQRVFVTVPASFDPAARQLVQEATAMATYPELVLLEEPQAAFYSWLHRHTDSWRDELKVGDAILVVDIGGGTTDFSLITVNDSGGNLELERLAVGSHLLLGGDNMDLAVAYTLKAKIEDEGHDLDDWQMQELIHASRKAKEELLTGKAGKEQEITIKGRGSSLIGSSINTKLSHDEVQSILVESFFPLTKANERSKPEKGTGIRQVGLPYAQDGRVSCQLAKFLSRTVEADSDSMESFIMPSAVLFNGGTMKAEALQQRMVDLLNSWAKELKKDPVKVLDGPDYDLAVSRGAAYYGLARQGQAIRIKSGTSHSYYIGVEEAVPAVPGIPAPMKAICVVPFGMEEGSSAQLENKAFSLILGEPVTFRFFAHSGPALNSGAEAEIGTVVTAWKKELQELHSIEVVLETKGLEGKTVTVNLKSKVTELGVLELWCVSESGNEWKLEFDIRKDSPALTVIS